MNRSIFQISALSLAVLSLTACGGSGSSTPTQATPVVQPTTTNTNTNTGNTNTSANTANQVTGAYVVVTPQDIAEELREEHRASQISAITITVDGKAQNTIDLASLPNGVSNRTVSYSANFIANNQAHIETLSATIRTLKQPNSVVLGFVDKGGRTTGGSINLTYPASNIAEIDYISGNATKTLPNSGTVNYVGKSFDNDSEGSFNYNINFGTKIGQGQVNIDGKTANLHATRIGTLTKQEDDQMVFSGYGIGDGRVSGGIVGEYTLGIFGNNAEEVAGYIDNANDHQTDVGFAGSKQ